MREDGGSASMHKCMVRGVVSNIGSLCQGALGESVRYRCEGVSGLQSIAVEWD